MYRRGWRSSKAASSDVVQNYWPVLWAHNKSFHYNQYAIK